MTREAEKRPIEYTPSSELELPAGLKRHFNEKGETTRWIRWYLDGREDTRNLSNYVREGWQFVTKSSIPEEFRDMFDTTKVRNNTQVVCVGDLILGKIDVDFVKSKQKYFEDASQAAVQAARDIAKETGDPRLDKYMPLRDESVTEGVTHPRR